MLSVWSESFIIIHKLSLSSNGARYGVCSIVFMSRSMTKENQGKWPLSLSTKKNSDNEIIPRGFI